MSLAAPILEPQHVVAGHWGVAAGDLHTVVTAVLRTSTWSRPRRLT